MPSPTTTPEVHGRAPSPEESVLVRVPADKDFVVLIRSAVGHLGAKLGCTVAEITDLRLAVNEACALLLGAPRTGGFSEGDVLECRIAVGPASLGITVVGPAGTMAGPEPGDFGWNILAALVDELSWSVEYDETRIELVKSLGERG
jgi:serine/threonine-protein kinase RsbW